jgi:hypothetical protein
MKEFIRIKAIKDPTTAVFMNDLDPKILASLNSNASLKNGI